MSDKIDDGAQRFQDFLDRAHVSTTSTVNATIHEYRAPTDASVKLLKEMEQAAEAKVIEAIHVGDSAFECVVHLERDHMAGEMMLRAVFKMNGRQQKAIFRFRERDAGNQSEAMRTAAAGIRDEVAKVIATEMIGPAFADVAGKFRVGRG